MMDDSELGFVSWAMRPMGPLANVYLTNEENNHVHEWMIEVINLVRRNEREAVIERLFKEDSHAARIDGSLRMVYIAEEVISAIKNREL